MVNVLYAHKSHPVEPLGIGYVSSSIARGSHKSRLLLTEKDLDASYELVERQIHDFKPKVFAQSIIFGNHLYAAELNKRVKEAHPDIVTVLGGPAGTFTPELIEDGWDVVCRYEGENPFLQLCNSLENGDNIADIPNLWIKRNPDLYHAEPTKYKMILDINDPKYKDDSGFDKKMGRFVNATGFLLEAENLDALPAPDRELLYTQPMYAEGPIKHFMHTRGCAFKCSYCFNVVQNMENKNKGTPVRRRSNESVIKEINDVRKKWPMELVYFQDDIFGPSYKVEYAEEFAEIYAREVGIPFHAHARFDLMAMDERIPRALAKAGLTGVHIAIEAGNDEIRNKVHSRGMTKEEILKGSEYCHKYGIKMMTQNILGAPGETKEQMIETLDLNIKVRPTFASASIFQPYPGTTALEYARDKGELPTTDLNALTKQFGMETFYNKSILIKDPAHRRWLELFQKFFALAVDQPRMHETGVLESIIASIAQTSPGTDLEAEGVHPLPRANVSTALTDIDKRLEHMYRLHRAEKDRILYGVELEEIVKEEN